MTVKPGFGRNKPSRKIRWMVEGRDSRGHFAKGNVPWNKRRDASPGVLTFKCRYCDRQRPLEEIRATTRFFPPQPCCEGCLRLLEG